MSMPTKSTLFLGDLSIFCTEDDLHRAFSPFGQIMELKIMRSEENNRNLSYGFIKFAMEHSAIEAMHNLDGALICGRNIKIRPATYRNKLTQKESRQDGLTNCPVHVSFISYQTSSMVTEVSLRSLFSRYGEVIDVSIKKCQIEREPHKQSGYGFVYFAFSNEGINAAVNSARDFCDTTFEDVNYKCSLSHNLIRNLGDADPQPPPLVPASFPPPPLAPVQHMGAYQQPTPTPPRAPQPMPAMHPVGVFVPSPPTHHAPPMIPMMAVAPPSMFDPSHSQPPPHYAPPPQYVSPPPQHYGPPPHGLSIIPPPPLYATEQMRSPPHPYAQPTYPTNLVFSALGGYRSYSSPSQTMRSQLHPVAMMQPAGFMPQNLLQSPLSSNSGDTVTEEKLSYIHYLMSPPGVYYTNSPSPNYAVLGAAPPVPTFAYPPHAGIVVAQGSGHSTPSSGMSSNDARAMNALPSPKVNPPARTKAPRSASSKTRQALAISESN